VVRLIEPHHTDGRVIRKLSRAPFKTDRT
jgi:hypothetical protein